MGKIRRSFDLSFKIRVCEAIENSQKTVMQICQQYQLQRPVVEGWLRKHISGELLAKSKALTREQELERELEKAKAKIGELTMLIDGIKKVENLERQARNEASLIHTPQNTGQSRMPAVRLGLPAPAITTSGMKRRN